MITRRVGGNTGSRLGCKCSEGFVGDDCSLNQQVRPDLEEGDDADDDVDDDADDVAVDDADLDANFDDDYVNKKVLVTTMMMMMTVLSTSRFVQILSRVMMTIMLMSRF